jgi:uncharacterized protein YndB with AHSA1/START domain
VTSPVRREVIVSTAPERAFELFTTRIGAWWPLEGYSVFRDGTVAFEGDLLVERSGDRESVWAEVLEWAPPESLPMTWHPGYGADKGTEVRVTFTAHGEGTLVSLVHTGWERMDNPDDAASQYGAGWPEVLASYSALVVEESS